MGNSLIGKAVFFWMFIIGGLFFGKWFGVIKDTKTTIMMIVGMALIYFVFQLFKYLGRDKRAAREAAQKAPVNKGNGKKKKKRK